ncbi:MAG TPA: hypothetical protein P5241_02265 [Candidatus Paceibacterota bacterium]|nr:hypothetical protein [Candidatus Paceibacterota bacterium]
MVKLELVPIVMVLLFLSNIAVFLNHVLKLAFDTVRAISFKIVFHKSLKLS